MTFQSGIDSGQSPMVETTELPSAHIRGRSILVCQRIPRHTRRLGPRNISPGNQTDNKPPLTLLPSNDYDAKQLLDSTRAHRLLSYSSLRRNIIPVCRRWQHVHRCSWSVHSSGLHLYISSSSARHHKRYRCSKAHNPLDSHLMLCGMQTLSFHLQGAIMELRGSELVPDHLQPKDPFHPYLQSWIAPRMVTAR